MAIQPQPQLEQLPLSAPKIKPQQITHPVQESEYVAPPPALELPKPDRPVESPGLWLPSVTSDLTDPSTLGKHNDFTYNPQEEWLGNDFNYEPTYTDTNFDDSLEKIGDTSYTKTDLATGIFGETRAATAADVDAGLATQVGQQIGTTVSLPQAEGAMLGEVKSDALDAANIRLGASDDKYANLTSSLNDINSDKLAVIDEQMADATDAANTLKNASDNKFEEMQTASSLLTPIEQNASNERFQDAKAAKALLDSANSNKFTNLESASSNLTDARQNTINETLSDAQTASGTIANSAASNLALKNTATDTIGSATTANLNEKLADAQTASNTISGSATSNLELKNTEAENIAKAEAALIAEQLDDAGSATDTMLGAAGRQFDKSESASSSLAQAEYDANRARYQNVTDALRADRLGAMRMGESSTTGTGDRMRLEAEMRAANDYSNLDNTARLREAERTLKNTDNLGQQETDFTKIFAEAEAGNQSSVADYNKAKQILNNVNSTEAERTAASKLLASAQLGIQESTEADLLKAQQVLQNVDSTEAERRAASSLLAQAEATNNLSSATEEGTQRTLQNTASFENQAIKNVGIEAQARMQDNQTQALVDQARRTLQNTQANASEVAEASKIIADTQYAANSAKAQLATKQEVFAALSAREDERAGIADELANVMQSTQDETLPAVIMAEQIIEQAIDEGNMEVKTAEEKYQAKIDKAKELLNNPSLMKVMADQVDDDLLTLGDEYTADQQLFLNRINNLKNIPGMVDTILNSVSDNEFAIYEHIYGQIGAMWAIGVDMNLVDLNGKVIPTNAYGEENTGEATMNAAGQEAVSVPGGEDESPIDIGVDDGTLNVNLNL